MAGLKFKGHRGGEIAADIFGNPEDLPVVLLPAVGQMKEMWHGAGRALGEAGRFAICIDLRGHGESDIALDGSYDLSAYGADLCAILSQLSARAVVVAVGASGAATLQAIGESAAPLVSALVLVGVTSQVDSEVASKINIAMAERTQDFRDAASALAAVRAVYPFEPQGTSDDKLLCAFDVGPDGRYRWRVDHRILGVIDIAAQSDRIEAACKGITVPAMLIRGTANAAVSAASTRHLQDLIKGSEYSEIEGAGHFVAIDQEDAFNATLLDFLERKVPRNPLRFESGSDPRVLRDALGCFGTGVTVVTTIDHAGQPVGFTANSFSSVSLEPPLILFCISKRSSNLETFLAAEGFAVNVLHIGQQLTSARFAQHHDSRFDGIEWDQHHSKAASPFLTGSLASFDCNRHAVVEAGDHVIFIGLVRYAVFEPHRDPLLYFRGKYRRLHFV
jgi:flavin reductase (DIM6/NTAB) family NADH-FMN oxidoreductase RutF/pimeloyl-ACP methyl ester carboxylesterase